MSDNSIKKLLKSQDRLRRQLEPFSAQLKALQADSGIQRLIKDANRHQELMRAALGPFEELHRSGALYTASKLGGEFQQMQTALAEAQKHFRLPEVAEATKLLQEFESSGAAQAIARFRQQQSETQLAMESMRAPWLDIENKIQSITGFVELQGIGQALRTMPAFATKLADLLRINLGDWRSKIDWPANIFTDPLARTAFYAARGLDPGLTNFPAGAFDQGATIAGIKGAPPPLTTPYDYELASEEDDKEAGFARTNDAHDRLQHLEDHIRTFIDEQMTAAFGENWTRRRIPGDMRRDWLEKKQKAQENGEPDRPLIEYADFTDYEKIIVKRENWRNVFAPVFKRQTLVQESFQRLYPVRICTMHARIITQDDELYLYVEMKRLLAAIGIVI